MQSLKYHSNLICLLGFVQDPQKSILVFENCANGDLLSLLKARKNEIINVSFWNV